MKKYLLTTYSSSALPVRPCGDWPIRQHVFLGTRDNDKDVQTNCSVNATIKGSTYCFSSQDAKTNFMKSPDANLKKAETFYKSEHKG